MGFDEFGTLSEHAARSTSWIVDASVVRLDDLNDQLDQRSRREELATTLPFGTSEVAEEILVDLTELVPFGVHRNLGEVLQQRHQDARFQQSPGPGG